jgi:hypothetical protein
MYCISEYHIFLSVPLHAYLTTTEHTYVSLLTAMSHIPPSFSSMSCIVSLFVTALFCSLSYASHSFLFSTLYRISLCFFHVSHTVSLSHFPYSPLHFLLLTVLMHLLYHIDLCSPSCLTSLYHIIPYNLHRVSYSLLFPNLYHMSLCSFSYLTILFHVPFNNLHNVSYSSLFPNLYHMFLCSFPCLTILYQFLSIISIMFLIPHCSLSSIKFFFLSHFSLSNTLYSLYQVSHSSRCSTLYRISLCFPSCLTLVSTYSLHHIYCIPRYTLAFTVSQFSLFSTLNPSRAYHFPS